MIDRLLAPIFVGLALFFCSSAVAQTIFIHNDDVKITLPDSVLTADCNPELASKAGDGCTLLMLNDEPAGVVFYRQSAGYALTEPGALEAHIQDSVAALSDIPNIKVVNARILPGEQRFGVMEVLRTDSAVATVTQLANPPITQTSLLIPLGDKLGQLFIYLPQNNEAAQQLGQSILNSAQQNIQVFAVAQPKPQANNASTPTSSLTLFPQALLWGGAAALLIILILHLLSRKRQKARENDEN